MAVPKRKLSKARTRRRKATWKRSIKTPNLVECKHCHAMKPSHVVCPSCGFYKDRQVLTINSKENTEE